jgi:hypothetical protein
MNANPEKLLRRAERLHLLRSAAPLILRQMLDITRHQQANFAYG